MSVRWISLGLVAGILVCGANVRAFAEDDDPLKPPPTPAAIDESTCAQLEEDKIKFIQSGIVADIRRGPEWAQQNLSSERLREIRLFIMLDEQLKFGCRGTNLAAEAERKEKAEAAKAALAARRAAAAARKKGK